MYLQPEISDRAIGQMSALALAHIGDAVYELMTRAYLACQGDLTAQNLHRHTIARVCAQAQARAAKLIEPMLSEQERAVFRRARNAKQGMVPKSCTLGEYSYATALEALFGWLWLSKQYARTEELYDLIIQQEAADTVVH